MSRLSLEDMQERIVRFRQERDWRKFHNAKDMAIGLCLEASELLELTHWKNGQELEEHLQARRQALADELADVLGWVLLIAHDRNIDLSEAFITKMAQNERKYPVDKAHGRSDKYTEL